MQLLELAEKIPKSNDRYDCFRCIACQNCKAVCPTNAITIKGEYRVLKGYWKNNDYPSGKTYPQPLERADGQNFENFENKLTETERVIYKRRSVRLYSKKQVPSELIKRVIEAGRFAPSAGNCQPWKFIVIQNRKIIDEINHLCKKTIKLAPYLGFPHAWLVKKTPGEKDARLSCWQKLLLPILVHLMPNSLDPRVRGGVNTVTSDLEYDIFMGAQTLVILLGDKRGIGEVNLDVGLCAQNMVLAAHSLGLATCYIGLITGLNFYPSSYRRNYGITNPYKIVTSLVLGYPRGEIDNIVAREQPRIHWIT